MSSANAGYQYEGGEQAMAAVVIERSEDEETPASIAEIDAEQALVNEDQVEAAAVSAALSDPANEDVFEHLRAPKES